MHKLFAGNLDSEKMVYSAPSSMTSYMHGARTILYQSIMHSCINTSVCSYPQKCVKAAEELFSNVDIIRWKSRGNVTFLQVQFPVPVILEHPTYPFFWTV